MLLETKLKSFPGFFGFYTYVHILFLFHVVTAIVLSCMELMWRRSLFLLIFSCLQFSMWFAYYCFCCFQVISVISPVQWCVVLLTFFAVELNILLALFEYKVVFLFQDKKNKNINKYKVGFCN